MSRIGRLRWSIEPAPGWTGRDDPECITIESEQGVGALQVSGYVQAGVVSDDDLEELAAERVTGLLRQMRSCVAGEFTGFAYERLSDGMSWREWYLRAADLALFVTYVCSPDNAGVDDADVDQMLTTLRLEAKHPGDAGRG